jgi:hypothetical protein
VICGTAHPAQNGLRCKSPLNKWWQFDFSNKKIFQEKRKFH